MSYLTITIDGPMGSGKSVLAAVVAKALREYGFDVAHLDDEVVQRDLQEMSFEQVKPRSVGVRSATPCAFLDPKCFCGECGARPNEPGWRYTGTVYIHDCPDESRYGAASTRSA